MSNRAAERSLALRLAAVSLLAATGSLYACGSDSSTSGGSTDSSGGSGSGGSGGGAGALIVGAGGFGAGGAPFASGGSPFGAGGLGAAGGALGGSGGTTNPDAGAGGGAGDPDGGDGGPTCIVPDAPIIPDTSIFPACAIPALDRCIDGRCVPTAAVPLDAQALLADCDVANKCVPDLFIQYNNQFIVKTCESVAGAEGRCLSLCIPQIADQASFLPQADCADGELCAPCFDPRTGENTSACSQGCDPGPQEPPTIFSDCCGGRGDCVPSSVVPEADRAQLGTDTCTGQGELCAPTNLQDLDYVPPTCTSLAGLEGRCLPDCVPAVAEQGDRLPVSTCQAGERCAPCYDPITGQDTGACRRGDDQPTNPPVTFPTCCGTLGHCVPSSILSTEQQAQLGTDTCTQSGDLCAPDVFAAAGQSPEVCRALGSFDAEGRCIPACVPSVAEQADRLSQATCDAGYLCAPCFDPITGLNTGACAQNGDDPVEPPKTFTDCCGGRGSCVPTSLVPAEDRSQLGTDTCQGTGLLCAPDKLSDPSYRPPQCASLAGLEGRCMADCLPAVAAQASRLPRSTCDVGELCAPCYDPITGQDTGACTRGDDQPTNPPVTFPTCCGTLGHCVPSSILSTEQQSQLGTDTCTQSGDLCAPDVFAAAGQSPEVCRALGSFNAEGRCIPACVPSVAEQADRLSQATCDAGYLCAPCFDPITGLDTGACTQNGDDPVEPPKTFTDCCGGRGSCVPTSLVPAEDRSQLGADTCQGTGLLCAPDKLSDPSYRPPQCASLAGLEGRCMADCLPAVAAQASRLPRSTCDVGELCAPCYDPITGQDTGACTRGDDQPTNPPTTFPTCCGTLGHCVPSSILSTDQQSQLGTDTCTKSGDLCAPDVFAVAGREPEDCRALGSFSAEGRCIPACVPSVASQADRLDQATCDPGYLCAPCFDPLTGASTGACNQNGDTPVEPVKTFASCCGALGVCVPSSIVPPDQASQLGRDSCAGTGFLCAPRALTDPDVTPTTCRAPGDMEARCLPACLPPIQAQAANLRQQTCATGELCAPCYNPLDGTDTGACRLNGDAPVEPAVTFAGCCPYASSPRGTCVPPELVSASQAASLPVDSCATGFLCAPNLKVADQTAKFPPCQLPALSLACTPPIFNAGCAGGCVPDCIVTDALQRSFLAQGTCAAGELCAPCVDPLSGARTGSCD